MSIHDDIRQAIRTIVTDNAHLDIMSPTWIAEQALNNYGAIAEAHHRWCALEGAKQVEPPSLRAWGGVFMRASRAGMLVRSGYANARDPKVHCNAVTVWQSMRCAGVGA